eukprot:Gregarina_sp_Pseudo_9__3949@NODE_4097_length_487_cov_2_859375_g3768_i0_p1_GENE_NODE_4097_length_487_cov_2_859375_g3768_i0NODE_4097_length_487_cov_2_859375_g3768_i0_p1_ORF_typecomplete_len100_score8_55_NODE_4097_length_487_cov_2_859375_g3768_i0137436
MPLGHKSETGTEEEDGAAPIYALGFRAIDKIFVLRIIASTISSTVDHFGFHVSSRHPSQNASQASVCVCVCVYTRSTRKAFCRSHFQVIRNPTNLDAKC